jgi:hypothetical protein
LYLISGNKMPTRCNRCFLLQILFFAQNVSGHHYAHHQELESIIHLVAACGLWCLVFKLSVWCGAEGCVSGLLQQPANRTHNPQLHTIPISWKPKHQIPQVETNCITLSSSWWWA